MKTLRNIVLAAGAIILAFALLARYVPGFGVTEFTYGLCLGISGTLLVVGLALAASPLYCRRKKDSAPTEAKR